MKRIFFNEDLFKLLKNIDSHFSNANIGISVIDKAIPEKDLQQLYSNQWHLNNKYFLILDDINKNTLQTLLNIIQFEGFFYGICINCKADTEILKQLNSIARDSNLIFILTKDFLTNDQLFLFDAKVVDTLYDL